MAKRTAPATTEPAIPANRILSHLGASEYRKFAAALEPIPLTFKETLYEPQKPIEYVYFLTSGMTSILTILEDGEQIETGTVGREGMLGISALLGATLANGRAICQIEGSALRIPADRFLAAVKRSERLRDLLLLYANAFMVMTMQNAACNRVHMVEARMARWLLMTHDRVDGAEFPLTQEFLGQMLGVRRPAVNVAGRALQHAGLIKYSRGRITIIDREGLESASCRCYEEIRRAYERVIAP